MPKKQLTELFTPFFATITDPRLQRGQRHSLLNVIILALCGTLAGADGWVDIERFCQHKRKFFKRYLDLPNGIPSHDTFGRVFSLLQPAALLACMQRWLESLRLAVCAEVIAIDGKTLRHSFDKAAEQGPLHLVSAWATQTRLVLGQVAVDSKSNEITAIPQLLALLELTGAIVTIDAMGCQKDIAADIIAHGANYVLALKDNQPTLCQKVHAFFRHHDQVGFIDKSIKRIQSTERGHGRVETREYYLAAAPMDLPAEEQWLGLNTIGMVRRTRVQQGKKSVEVCYYISSLEPKVRKFAKAVRSHWGIENRLHWILDVTFAEDQSRVRKDHSPANLGMLRRLALSILQRDTTVKDSIRGKRQAAGWNEDRLLAFLTGFSRD